MRKGGYSGRHLYSKSMPVSFLLLRSFSIVKDSPCRKPSLGQRVGCASFECPLAECVVNTFDMPSTGLSIEETAIVGVPQTGGPQVQGQPQTLRSCLWGGKKTEDVAQWFNLQDSGQGAGEQ